VTLWEGGNKFKRFSLQRIAIVLSSKNTKSFFCIQKFSFNFKNPKYVRKFLSYEK
jgi:hypothetical protein